MKVAIAYGGPASGKTRDWHHQVEFLREAEQMGVDIIWSAEAWGMDGVSSLAYLVDLPIDCLKIDQAFVRQCAESERHRNIVRAVGSVGWSNALRSSSPFSFRSRKIVQFGKPGSPSSRTPSGGRRRC